MTPAKGERPLGTGSQGKGVYLQIESCLEGTDALLAHSIQCRGISLGDIHFNTLITAGKLRPGGQVPRWGVQSRTEVS